MPHRCVRCGIMYEDGAKEILKGCSCGARLFFFVKKKNIEKSDEIIEKLSEKDKNQIESDVYDILGVDKKKEEAPVVLDLESIKILKPGKFELDLVNLFNKDQPLVYKLEEGKYVIDIPESFVREKEAKEEK
jgi:uncharacterized protein